MKNQFIFTIALFVIGSFIAGLLFSNSSKTTVVLLNNGKKQNAVVVSTNKGSSQLDKVGSYVDLKDKESAISEVKTMTKEEIKRRFGKVLAASPKKPVSYMVYFKPKSKELTKESKEVLSTAIEMMKKRTPCVVDLIGHTDTKGSNELNIKVSIQRAKLIESILKDRGIEVLSLKAKGYGEEDLQVKTADNVAEAKNRNVEIFIK